MKKLANVVEVEGEGLTGLLGENVILFCMNYFYAGKLAGVNENDVLLENAEIVYETGALTGKSWQDAQATPGPLYVRISAIEAYCLSGR